MQSNTRRSRFFGCGCTEHGCESEQSRCEGNSIVPNASYSDVVFGTIELRRCVATTKAATHRERLHIKHKNEPSVATFDLLRIEPTHRYVIYVSQCPHLSRLVCTFNLLIARFYDKFFLTL
jgi:hypothetical protein